MKVLFSLSIFLITIPSFSSAPPLKDSMVIIGQNFGVLAQAFFQQQKIDRTHLSRAQDIQLASAESETEYPDTANTPEKKAEYSRMINELTLQSIKLEDEMNIVLESDQDPQDLAKCIEIYLEMNQLRQDGHEMFQ